MAKNMSNFRDIGPITIDTVKEAFFDAEVDGKKDRYPLNRIVFEQGNEKTIVWNKPIYPVIKASFNKAKVNAKIFKDDEVLYEGTIGDVPHTIETEYGAKIRIVVSCGTNQIVYPGANTYNQNGNFNDWKCNNSMNQCTFEKIYTEETGKELEIVCPALLPRANNIMKEQWGQHNSYYEQGNYAYYVRRDLAPLKGIRYEQRYAGFVRYEYYDSHFIGLIFHNRMQTLKHIEGGDYAHYSSYGFKCDHAGPGAPGMRALKLNYENMMGNDGKEPVKGDICYSVFYDGNTVKYRPYQLNNDNIWLHMDM